MFDRDNVCSNHFIDSLLLERNVVGIKHLNATHFTCNIGADMVKKIRAKIQKDLPSKEYCTPVNYDPDDVSAALTNEVNKCFGEN